MRPTNSNPLREKIANDVADYLAAGGKITELPYSPDQIAPWLPDEQYDRLEEARKKAMKSKNWRKPNSSFHNGRDVSSEKQRHRASTNSRKFRSGNKQAKAA